MVWQLRDPELRAAIRELVDRMQGRCALAGTVGAQLHVAEAIGLDKLGPPAHAIEVVPLGAAEVPERVGRVPVRVVDARGFDTSIEAGRREIEIDGATYPVASPEHVIGTTLASDELQADGRWACFVLMRVLESRGFDLEEIRGFVKRCDAPDREVLLHELSYLAA
jgi:hypothetical protein